MDSPPANGALSKRAWWDDFKSPVNLIGWTLAVLGIVVSVYLYFKSKETRELSLRLVAVTKVYDSSSTSRKLSVLDSENKRVTNDVYVASYQMWNSGTLPIEPADVRRPFKMQLVGDARTIDWTITYCISDPDVCGFRFEANDTNVSPRSVTLKWLHCDPQHGCQFQLLYTGTATGALSFDSPFSGNGRVIDANYGIRRYQNVAGRLFGASAALSTVCLPCFVILIDYLRKYRWITRSAVIFMLVLCAVCVVSGFWFFVSSRPLKTPFPANVPINFKTPTETSSQ